MSWPLECECGWGGGKWPPASTESQRTEWGKAAGPTLAQQEGARSEESEVGWGWEGETGCLRPQQIPEVAGKQAFHANIAQ